MLDEPGEVVLDDWELDVWIECFWRHPLLDHDASVVAVAEGTPAAVTFLQVDRSTGRGTNNGTGTLREFRGRGLATLAKRASLARAAELGVTAVYTGNDVTNGPMQAINRKLGYRPSSTTINWGKDLVTT
jgi:RimJ/RimL family protein N-acetyltransferase